MIQNKTNEIFINNWHLQKLQRLRRLWDTQTQRLMDFVRKNTATRHLHEMLWLSQEIDYLNELLWSGQDCCPTSFKARTSYFITVTSSQRSAQTEQGKTIQKRTIDYTDIWDFWCFWSFHYSDYFQHVWGFPEVTPRSLWGSRGVLLRFPKLTSEIPTVMFQWKMGKYEMLPSYWGYKLWLWVRIRLVSWICLFRGKSQHFKSNSRLFVIMHSKSSQNGVSKNHWGNFGPFEANRQN